MQPMGSEGLSRGTLRERVLNVKGEDAINISNLCIFLERG